MATYTNTFCEAGENHKGMQQIGEKATDGFTLDELQGAKAWFDQRNISTELIHLNELLSGELRLHSTPAHLLVARNGLSVFSDDPTFVNSFMEEQTALEKDKKAFMYGAVKNKKARHNLCFGPTRQAPDYEKKKGTIVAFKDVPLLSSLRDKLPEMLGEKARNLYAEGNYYYDIVKECYIGFHGDTERLRVVGVRMGATLPLHYHWWHESKPVGDLLSIDLNGGDIYVMSEKAVGTDWKEQKIYTLRHAAGRIDVMRKKKAWYE